MNNAIEKDERVPVSSLFDEDQETGQDRFLRVFLLSLIPFLRYVRTSQTVRFFFADFRDRSSASHCPEPHVSENHSDADSITPSLIQRQGTQCGGRSLRLRSTHPSSYSKLR
ncbi:MAG: hypothetical protein ACUVXJ_10425 [Phycisphaerae bacterium]